MRPSVKRRLALATAATTTFGAVTTLVAGVTFGLFSATLNSPTNHFATGSVSLTQAAATQCNLTSMVPNDSSKGAPIGSNDETPCTFGVSYTGVSAYLAVDIDVAIPGSGALYDGTSKGLQLYLTDGGGNHYVYGDTVVPGGTGTQLVNDAGSTVTLPVGDTKDLLITTAATTSTTVTLTLDYGLTSDSGSYTSAAVDVTLTVHAVQSEGNTLSCASTPTIGHQCSGTGGFVWS